jgi:orotate phosphoribosyltransferase-like protein
MSGYWSTLVAAAFSRRDAHRPQDRDTLRAAALELAGRGLTPADIAEALRLSEAAVRELLGEAQKPRTTPEIP